MPRLIIIPPIVLAMLLLGASPPTLSSSHGFEGGWFAKGQSDGSCLYLRIVQKRHSAGHVFSLQGTDSDTSEWCVGESRMEGLGVLDAESHLVTTAVWWCNPDNEQMRYFEPNSLEYDSATDTLIDSTGAVFHRQRLLLK